MYARTRIFVLSICAAAAAVCDSNACLEQLAGAVKHGCKRLRGVYELQWASKLAAWHNATAAYANATRLVPLRSEIALEPGVRYISIADIHGDFEALCRTLVAAGVMDLEAQWLAGTDAVLIQTGDIVDRGLQSATSYQLLFDLQDQTCALSCRSEAARIAGCVNSQVFLLYGNHEHWHLSDTHHETVEPNWFLPTKERLTSMVSNIDYENEKLDARFRAYLKAAQGHPLPPVLQTLAKKLDGARLLPEIRLEKDYPDLLALLETVPSRDAQSPEHAVRIWRTRRGLLGAEIWRRYQTLLKLGNQAVYVHAGLEYATVAKVAKRLGARDSKPGQIIDAINGDVQAALRGSRREQQEHFLFAGNGPLWTRLVATHGGAVNSSACQDLERVLKRVEVAALVVGHSVVPLPFAARCEGGQILMDTGMSYRMRGHKTAVWLEIAAERGGAAEWRAWSWRAGRARAERARAPVPGGRGKSEL